MDENKNQSQTPLTTEQPPQQVTPTPQPDVWPYNLVAPTQRNDTEQSDRKLKKWRAFFLALGVMQAIGIGVFVLVIFGVAGQTGSEFMVLLMFATLGRVIAALAVVNVIGLLVYLRRYKPSGKDRIFTILSLVISLAITLYGSYMTYQMYAVPQRYSAQYTEETKRQQEQFKEDNAQPEISKEYAIELLKTCKLQGFYYTNETLAEQILGVQFPSAKASSTGIVLVKVDGLPSRIRVADRLVSELVPIAREAQKKCTRIQFWHDGAFEQYANGKWYFNGEVVNDALSGITKDDAIKLLQDCEVDSFIGYTDSLDVVKDANSKSWLQRAEKTSTGIEALMDTSATFLFTSKAMTAELLDIARQYRQSCYDTRGLFVSVDDWTEVEYPLGTWTKVRR